MAFWERGSLQRGREQIQEIIGQVAVKLSARVTGLFARLTVDWTQADYAFWDRLRRGKEPTYQIGGLFAKPIVHHMVAWALGGKFTLKSGNEATDEALSRFVRANIMNLVRAWKDSLALGDMYIVTNADGTLTLVPPNQVEKVVDDLDYRRVLSYKIVSKLDKATIEDEYRADGRTLRVKRYGGLSFFVRGALGDETAFEFANPTRRVLVTHIANERSSNEVYGHPVYEALLKAFAEYDDITENSITGVKAMGNPKPVLSEVEDPTRELAALSTGSETYTDRDGSEQTEAYQVDMAALEMIATTGEFSYKGPGSFTDDAWRMMKGLFYLMLQHTNIPEWVWGGHIESSQASVKAQMPAWTRFVDLLRLSFEEFLLDLLRNYLAVIALYTQGIQADAEIEIEWPPLTEVDREIRLKEVQFARMDDLLGREDALRLLNVVDDPAAVVERAQAESEGEADEFDAAVEAELERIRQGEDEATEPTAPAGSNGRQPEAAA